MIADYVRHLQELAAPDASSVGAKAATLGELMRAGFRVPTGFCLPASGYRHFVASAGLEPRLLGILSQADLSDPTQCEGAAAEIRRLFLAARLPREMRQAVGHAYLALSHRLGEEEAAVAVRASPLGADACGLPPGYHETVLNVIGVEALGAALKQCWAALHSSQALRDRAAREISHESAAMAVVVQRLVGAAASGVMFTADPATGDPLRVVIPACFGLGEGLAGGALPADRCVVDAASVAVIERETADKSLMVGRAEEPAQGTVVVPVPPARRRQPALSDEQAVALARVGLQIDQHFDARCEAAWAIADGEIFVLSAKPMAGLPAFFPTALPGDRRRTFTLSLRQPDPVPPLSRDLWRLIVRRFNRSAARGRLLGLGSARWTLAVLNGYHYGHAEARPPWRPRSTEAVGLRYLWQWPWACWLAGLWRGRAAARAERARERLRELAGRPETAAGAAAEAVVELVGSLDELLGYAHTLGSLTREISEAAPRLLRRVVGAGRAAAPEARFAWAGDVLPAAGDGLAARREAALQRLIGRAQQDTRIEQAFAADLPGEVIRALEARPEGRAFLEEARAFAAEYALLDPLALADLDDGPGWMQDVEALLMGIRRHLFRSDQAARERALRERAARRDQAVRAARASLSAGPLGRMLPWRRRLFDHLLRTVSVLQPLADDCGEEAPMRAAAAAREGLRLLAAALVREGYLESPDELAFLSLGDIETLAGGGASQEALRAAVQRRRRRLRRQACLTPPERIPPVAGVAPHEDAPAPGDGVGLSGSRLAGQACSPGKATGPARYVDSPRDLSQFRPGDVLICGHGRSVHAVLFSMAAAFVQEENYLTSHCALLARQYGVPAVVGVPGLARRLRDGQVVTVDGTTGTVSLEPQAGV